MNNELTPGQKLRKMREKQNKTIEEVAKDLNISYQAMQSYETDTRMPRVEKMKAIAKYYGTTMSAVFFNNQ